jgi:hypothetical protein
VKDREGIGYHNSDRSLFVTKDKMKEILEILLENEIE